MNVKALSLIATLAYACSTSSVSAASLASTFDTDLDGWTGSGVELQFVPSGGNPGGFLRANDLPFTSFIQAPASYLGNLVAFDDGTLSFDLKVFSTDLQPQGAGGNVTLRSAGISVTRNVINVPMLPVPSDWVGGSIMLSSASWGMDNAAWQALLSNITAIEIVVDPSPGGNNRDVAGLDNFRIASANPIPEPAAIWLFGSGIALLGLRFFRSPVRDEPIETRHSGNA